MSNAQALYMVAMSLNILCMLIAYYCHEKDESEYDRDRRMIVFWIMTVWFVISVLAIPLII